MPKIKLIYNFTFIFPNNLRIKNLIFIKQQDLIENVCCEYYVITLMLHNLYKHYINLRYFFTFCYYIIDKAFPTQNVKYFRFMNKSFFLSSPFSLFYFFLILSLLYLLCI